MKLLRYGRRRREAGMLDMTARSAACAWCATSMASRCRRRRWKMLAGLDPNTLPRVEGNPRIGPCVVRPVNYVCIGLNYADHAAETGNPMPKEPIVFLKSLGAFRPERRREAAARLEEAGLGGRARHRHRHDRALCAGEQAMDYVAGYCVCNDVSEREFQTERGGTWDKGKGCDTFGPTGPWMVTKDEVADPQNLPLWTEVNGKRMQNGTTKTMIFGVVKAGQLCQPLHHAARRRRHRDRHAAGCRRGHEAGAGVPAARRHDAAGGRGPRDPDPAGGAA